jgi:hypothetical protein
MIKESKDFEGKTIATTTSKMKESTKRDYIQKNYPKEVYQAYIINDAKTRALYVFKQQSAITDEQERKHYLDLITGLGIITQGTEAWNEYMKLKNPKNK